MTTSAFVGSMYLYRGSGASPEVFSKVCQVFSISGVGATNELVDATTFCSDGAREYIGGLADGAEITLECNYESAAMAGSPQGILNKMLTDVADKAIRNFRVQDENSSPAIVFGFAAICLGWALNPSVDDRNTITFTLKVTGDITVSGG